MRKRTGLPDVGDLPRMTAPELQAVHLELFGSKHRIANCQHLRRKIAWHLQSLEEGGLPESVRQYAHAIARQSDLRVRMSENLSRRRAGVSLDQTVTSTVVQSSDARLPMPGCLLVKEYKGQTIVVKVLQNGFEYDGRRFRSLSALAREITGTRWNGMMFFGLARGVHS